MAAGCPRSTSRPRRIGWRGFWIFVLVLLAINWLSVLLVAAVGAAAGEGPVQPVLPVQQVQAGQVKSISSKADTIRGRSRPRSRYPPGDAKATPTTLFSTQVPAFWNNNALTALLQRTTCRSTPRTRTRALRCWRDPARVRPDAAARGSVLCCWRGAPRLAPAAWADLGNFGRSQARRVDPEKIRVTFDDVAGIDEAKGELTEIVDFLKTPDRYRRLGGRIPHGVLLFGPPGTGKTLLARAVAGEARAAFFSIAASEFIEAIVGVGAARVRDLFAKAKEAAPAIIFIDELDAIGRSRQGSAGITGANDEREQTLDQILTEMDGFESHRSGRRPRRDQPAGDPRPGAVASGALRPPRRRAATRQGGAPEDPPGAYPVDAARRGRRPRCPGLDHAGDGRCGPGQPGQRGGAVGGPARPRQGSHGRLHRRAREGAARGTARDRPQPGGPRADRLPRIRPRAGRHAHAREPIPSGRCRSSRAARPSA